MITFQDYLAVQNLYSNYAMALDEGRLEEWPGFFVENGIYKLQSKENFERNFPLALMWCESQGMMKDRVHSIRETFYNEPYYQRHVVSAARITAVDSESIHAEASYMVVRIKRDQFPEILNVGRYIDIISIRGGLMKFSSRLCLFDNQLISNSIIYPI